MMSSYFDEMERELCGALERGAHLPAERRLARRSQRRLGPGVFRMPWARATPRTPWARGVLRTPWARAIPRPPWAHGVLRTPWARATLGVVGAGAAAAIVLSILNLSAGAEQAFAGWSASPTAPTAGETAAAEAACEPKLLSSPMNVANTVGGLEIGGWQAMVADTRGPNTMLYYESGDGDARAICLNGAEGTVLSASEVGRNLASETPAPAATGISIALTRHAVMTLPTGEEHAYAEIAGFTGSEVSGVTLTLSDGTQVVASTGNDRLLAWWPGTAHAISAVVATSSGTSTQSLPAD